MQRANIEKRRRSAPEGEGLKSLQPKPSPPHGGGLQNSRTVLRYRDKQTSCPRLTPHGTEPCWHQTCCSAGLVFKDRGPWRSGLSKGHWKRPSWSLLSNRTCTADSWVSTKNAVNPYFVYLLLCPSPFLWVGLNQDTIHGGNTKRNRSSYGFLWSNAENTLLAASARRNAAGTQAKQLSREPETDKRAMA